MICDGLFSCEGCEGDLDLCFFFLDYIKELFWDDYYLVIVKNIDEVVFFLMLIKVFEKCKIIWMEI